MRAFQDLGGFGDVVSRGPSERRRQPTLSLNRVRHRFDGGADLSLQSYAGCLNPDLPCTIVTKESAEQMEIIQREHKQIENPKDEF